MRRVIAAVANPRAARRLARVVPWFDRLEGRELMAVSAGQSLKKAIPVDVQPLQLKTVPNAFGAGVDQSNWKVKLNKGDFVGLDLDTPDGQASQITVLDGSGKVVARSPKSADPSMLVGVKETGTYYVQVDDKTPQAGTEVDNLKIRRFAIDQGLKAPTAPSDVDERWAWASGKTLYIAESDGTGYGIKADWKKVVSVDPATGMKQATYQTDGKMEVDVKVPVTVKSPNGKEISTDQYKTIKVPMTGSMKVSINPGTWGASLGTVSTTDVGGLPPKKSEQDRAGEAKALTALLLPSTPYPGSGVKIDATALLAEFQSRYGLKLSGTPPLLYSVGTGAQLGHLGLPLAADQTYYYARVNNGPSVSFGGITASASNATSFTLVINMADPSVYVSAGPVNFGASVKGLIPFKPRAANYSGPAINGNLWGKLPQIQLGTLPVSIAGDAVISLDPSRTGRQVDLNGDASTFFGASAADRIGNQFANLGIGINGAGDLGFAADGSNLSIPVASASVGYVPSQTPGYELQKKPGKTDLYGNPIPLPDRITSTDPRLETYRSIYSDFYNVVPVPRTTISNYAIAGSTTNLFRGTALEQSFAGNYFQVSASSSGTNATELLQNAKLSARSSSSGIKLLGYTLGLNQSAAVTADRDGVTFNGSINVFNGQSNLTGKLYPSSENFYLASAVSLENFPTSPYLKSVSGYLNLYSRAFSGALPALNLQARFGFSNIIEVKEPDNDLGFFTVPGKYLGRFGASGTVSSWIFIRNTGGNYEGYVEAEGSQTAYSQPFGGKLDARVTGRSITVFTSIPYVGNFSFNI